MKYTVLWSGGFDSTYMIQNLLEDQNNTVKAYYVAMGTEQSDKAKMELHSISKLKEVFKDLFKDRFEYKEIVFSISHHKHNTDVYTPQLMTLLHALYECVEKDTDRVALGFVMNDSSISYIEDLKTIWSGFSELCMLHSWPKLVFPLSKFSKSSTYYYINKKLKELCVCCEYPQSTPNRTFCDTCEPCKRNRAAGLIDSITDEIKPKDYKLVGAEEAKKIQSETITNQEAEQVIVDFLNTIGTYEI